MAWMPPRSSPSGMPGMNIEVMQANQVAVVVPNGDLNAASGMELKRTLQDLLDKGNTRLVVDMGYVAYIDSVVWGELAVATALARAAGGELRVCAMCGELLAIVTMIRLSRVMAVFPTREDAMVFEGKPEKHLSRDLLVRSPFRRTAITNSRQV